MRREFDESGLGGGATLGEEDDSAAYMETEHIIRLIALSLSAVVPCPCMSVVAASGNGCLDSSR